MLNSDKKTIKSINRWRYTVTLSQDRKGIFHVSYENLLTKEVNSLSFIDYIIASHVFESKYNSFEGH